MKEPKIGRKELIEVWLLCRTVLDYKDKLISTEEALEEFRIHTGLPRYLAKLLFDPMRKESKASLKKAYPDWIKPPEFEDYTNKSARLDRTNKRYKPRGKPPVKLAPPEQSDDTPP